jgi:hypothetical protein
MVKRVLHAAMGVRDQGGGTCGPKARHTAAAGNAPCCYHRAHIDEPWSSSGRAAGPARIGGRWFFVARSETRDDWLRGSCVSGQPWRHGRSICLAHRVDPCLLPTRVCVTALTGVACPSNFARFADWQAMLIFAALPRCRAIHPAP